MEIRLKALAGGVIALFCLMAVIMAAAAVLPDTTARRLQSLLASKPSLPAPPAQGNSPLALLPTVTPRLAQVSVRDESAAWDWAWEPACLTDLQRHLGATKARDVTFVLADDPTLSLGIAYPSIEYPDAIGLTRCAGESNVLTCRLSVSKGSPGASLDATMTATALYGVEEFYRARNRQEWELRAGWEWDRFAPFLHQEGNAWRSNCVRLSAE
jgi:hypothetical protein